MTTSPSANSSQSQPEPGTSGPNYGTRDLKYAERQLGTEGREKIFTRKRLEAEFAFALYLAVAAIVLILSDNGTERILGGALTLTLLYSFVKSWRASQSGQRAILETSDGVNQDPEPSAAEGEPGSVDAQQRFLAGGEALLEPYVGELLYAEHQLRKAGEFVTVIDRVYRRRLIYLVLSAPLALMLVFGKSMWALFLVPIALRFYWVRQARLEIRQLAAEQYGVRHLVAAEQQQGA